MPIDEPLRATLIRLPESLIDALKEDGRRNERSLAATIRFHLSRALSAAVPKQDPTHVCTKWRMNSIGKNVCVDDACQKPKHR